MAFREKQAFEFKAKLSKVSDNDAAKNLLHEELLLKTNLPILKSLLEGLKHSRMNTESSNRDFKTESKWFVCDLFFA